MSMVESQPHYNRTRLFIIMGVAGCGKSSVGEAVAKHFGGVFLEGDAYHPQSNIDKMSNGEALNDEDRWPWLKVVSQEMAAQDGLVFTGCSALKQSYREFITSQAGEPVLFIYLDGTKELIAERMAQRVGHFMPTTLLESQFDTLEIPTDGEFKIAIDIAGSQSQVIKKISEKLENLFRAGVTSQVKKEGLN